MIILFSPYLPSHDQDDYALCWVFKKNTICMCIMALLEGACCWNYGLGPFILINTIKEFKAHY